MWEHLIDIKCNKKAIYCTINKEKKNNFFCYIFISFITKLFNKIYTQRSLPEQWLFAKITPVPKKGLKNNIENYRPIANLFSASKFFEKLILQRVLEIEKDSNLDITGNFQHGFNWKRSTCSAGLVILFITVKYGIFLY